MRTLRQTSSPPPIEFHPFKLRFLDLRGLIEPSEQRALYGRRCKPAGHVDVISLPLFLCKDLLVSTCQKGFTHSWRPLAGSNWDSNVEFVTFFMVVVLTRFSSLGRRQWVLLFDWLTDGHKYGLYLSRDNFLNLGSIGVVMVQRHF